MQLIAANADLGAYDYGAGSEGEHGEEERIRKRLELVGNMSSEAKRKEGENKVEDDSVNHGARVTPVELRKGAKSPIEAPNKRVAQKH